MKTKLVLMAWLLSCILSHQAIAQSAGDYKSNGTGGGAWNNAATWLVFNGTQFIPATAAPVTGTPIRVQAKDTITITSVETISKLVVDSSGAVTVSSGQTATLAGDITVLGLLAVNGTLVCNTNTITGKGRFQLNAGATLQIGSPAGISASGATGNIQTGARQFAAAANYSYTSGAAQVTGTGLPANLTGTVTDNNTNTASGLTLSQNVSINSPGSFVVPASRVLSIKGSNAITGTGSFVLNSGATFYIGHAAGISMTAGTGCIQVAGTKTFSATANYVYNGSVAQVTGNALPSPIAGILTITNTSIDGCRLSKDLVINTPGRITVTGALACSSYIVSGTGAFTLNAGGTLLTGHPAGLSATGAYGSIQTAAINYNAGATYMYNGTVAQVTGDGLPSIVANFGVNATAANGVALTNNTTVTNNLLLTGGNLCLNGKTLTIAAAKTITRQNGTLSLCGGNLLYGGTINLTYTSTINLTPDIEMPASTNLLNNLTIALTPGKTLTIDKPITVNGSVFMTSGSLAPRTNLSYGPKALLVYNSASAQTTGTEWPDSAFNVNISIRNTNAAGGVVLNAHKKAYSGTLMVPSGGFFNTGNFTLSGTGSIVVSAGGTFMTPQAQGVSPEGAIRLTGARTFATGSNYTFNGTVPQVTGREMPLSVSVLTLNNTAPNRLVTLSNAGTGTQTITGSLVLTSGVFDLNTNNMSLLFHTGNIPISRTTGTLLLGTGSSMQFGTTGFTGGAAFTLPDNVFASNYPLFRNLVLNRANMLTVGNQNLTLNGTLQLTYGVLNMVNTTLTFQNSDVPVRVDSGSITVGPRATLQFGGAAKSGGAAFTLPDRMFTTPPTFGTLSINRVNPLTLGTQKIALTSNLNLVSGTLQMGTDTLSLYSDITMGAGTLRGGKTAILNVSGVANTLTLPAIENGLKTLVVARPNAGATPSILLNADLHIDSVLDLGGGSIGLGNNNLTLGAGAVIQHADAQHYIVNTSNPKSGGSLVQQVGKSGVSFPVGTLTYTPAFIKTADTLHAFRVRVFDGVPASDTSFAAFGYSKDAVNKTWVIEKVVTDSSKATVTLQWNAGDENTGFNRKKSFVSGMVQSQWDTTAATEALDLGLETYRQSRAGISNFTRFSVQEDRSAVSAKWLSSLAAKSNKEVVLKWKVKNGFDHFVIERSVNALSFQGIGNLTVTDTTAGATEYLFYDQAPVQYQYSYYRIKGLTEDGQFEYSEVMKIAPNQIEGSLVYPVPVQNQLNIALYATRTGPVAVYMIDISGKLVKKQAVQLRQGNNVITVPMQDVPKGVYLVQVLGDGVHYDSHKIVK